MLENQAASAGLQAKVNFLWVVISRAQLPICDFFLFHFPQHALSKSVASYCLYDLKDYVETTKTSYSISLLNRGSGHCVFEKKYFSIFYSCSG